MLHRKAEQHSLRYHAAIADRLAIDPSIAAFSVGAQAIDRVAIHEVRCQHAQHALEPHRVSDMRERVLGRVRARSVR
jgi:hypothetical protein